MSAQVEGAARPRHEHVRRAHRAGKIALLAAKADLREELDRLSAHCREARALIAGKTRPGEARISFTRI